MWLAWQGLGLPRVRYHLLWPRWVLQLPHKQFAGNAEQPEVSSSDVERFIHRIHVVWGLLETLTRAHLAIFLFHVTPTELNSVIASRRPSLPRRSLCPRGPEPLLVWARRSRGPPAYCTVCGNIIVWSRNLGPRCIEVEPGSLTTLFWYDGFPLFVQKILQYGLKVSQLEFINTIININVNINININIHINMSMNMNININWIVF